MIVYVCSSDTHFEHCTFQFQTPKHPHPMSTPSALPANSPTCPPSVGFDGKKMAINIGWVCLAALVVVGTIMLILGMVGCTSSSRSSFTPSQGWSNLGRQEVQNVGVQTLTSEEPLVMPPNFAEAMKTSSPKVEDITPDGFSSWPAAVQAKFRSGVNPIWVRNGQKAKFYGDPRAPWNPDPTIPADVLAGLKQGHARR